MLDKDEMTVNDIEYEVGKLAGEIYQYIKLHLGENIELGGKEAELIARFIIGREESFMSAITEIENVQKYIDFPSWSSWCMFKNEQLTEAINKLKESTKIVKSKT